LVSGDWSLFGVCQTYASENLVANLVRLVPYTWCRKSITHHHIRKPAAEAAGGRAIAIFGLLMAMDRSETVQIFCFSGHFWAVSNFDGSMISWTRFAMDIN